GVVHSDYPAVFWERMLLLLEDCQVINDIGCGPGAFALKALEAGLRVQAVDANRKNLQALKAKAEELQLDGKCDFFHHDWLEAEVDEADASVAAYSFAGSIGSPAGLMKIVNTSRKAAFFIIPYELEKLEFLSGPLYKQLGIMPPCFSKPWPEAVAEILTACHAKLQQATIDVLEYDFGIPLHKHDTHACALFLSRKMGLEAVELLEEHIEKIKIVRNGSTWVPNPRKSVLVTCLF
ncbi:MAG: class I SAM-dependent methyltransferase, partial [Desulfotomaculaceae bacterium]